MKIKAITAIHKPEPSYNFTEEELKPATGMNALNQMLGFNDGIMRCYDYLKANPKADFLDVCLNVKFKPI